MKFKLTEQSKSFVDESTDKVPTIVLPGGGSAEKFFIIDMEALDDCEYLGTSTYHIFNHDSNVYLINEEDLERIG